MSIRVPGFGEADLVELPAMALLEELGWETLDAYQEFDEAEGSPLGRETKGEVVLIARLHAAL